MKRHHPLLLLTASLAAVAPIKAQPNDAPVAQCQHSRQAKDGEMQHRGNEAMGFDQGKTRHHFLLTQQGGMISVEANDLKDTESRDQVRLHLEHISRAFAAGDFDIPMFVHGKTPDGVEIMKARKDQIRYRFEATGVGGRVVITSTNSEAVKAIHEFLTFQIREHSTGDDLVVR
jgi:hypothetical protein